MYNYNLVLDEATTRSNNAKVNIKKHLYKKNNQKLKYCEIKNTNRYKIGKNLTGDPLKG